MADVVLVEGLAVETVIGVYDWEREITQRLLVDLEMAWDNRVPAASDDVSDALDYATVSERVGQCIQALQPQLIEAAAEAVASMLQQDFGVSWLRLTIRKPGAVPAATSVGVRIERGQR
ncbi:dihydroneopterin aldolase [Marinobacter sp. S0848L]|uniref:dihydroneopterin aldolase n=1 Tax=Marinobacter sp. S0848L TaxID=2926423 RepID=UPI001FF313CA|nr:dihydroneopterin aldolase [Marinobacter sp. S0848L]MCK0106979.1 dihydroneopterin aldolase [Marinobacter sp. S0848L]